MASLPPEMETSEILEMAERFAGNPEAVAQSALMAAQLPGSESFYAALIMVFQDVTIGECKDCVCSGCQTLRGIITSMAGQFGD